jgi:hypothetical protein
MLLSQLCEGESSEAREHRRQLGDLGAEKHIVRLLVGEEEEVGGEGGGEGGGGGGAATASSSSFSSSPAVVESAALCLGNVLYKSGKNQHRCPNPNP